MNKKYECVAVRIFKYIQAMLFFVLNIVNFITHTHNTYTYIANGKERDDPTDRKKMDKIATIITLDISVCKKTEQSFNIVSTFRALPLK